MEKWQLEFDELFNSEDFNHDLYVEKYPDVKLTGLSPLEHYLRYGRAMGRSPCSKSADQKTMSTPNTSLSSGLTTTPLVSIICITYNHESFISQTLEGILEQRTDFDFEVLIGNDASTDGTDTIIKRYVEKHHNIKYFNRTPNLGANSNFIDLARRVKGKYVAICEGDDFWNDNLKLQNQVDFLENNPEFSICFHPVKVIYEGNPSKYDVFPKSKPENLSLEKLLESNFIQTNSVMYRWRFGVNSDIDFNRIIAPADWYIHLLHAEVGRIGYIDKIMGVYRKHHGGMWASHQTAVDRFKKLAVNEIAMFEELEKRFGLEKDNPFWAAQNFIFSTVANYYLQQSDFISLASLINKVGPLALKYMGKMGLYIEDYSISPELLTIKIKEQMRVSVIVTSYNHAKYISRCIESIIAQVGAFDIEIIVGDDKSTDETPLMIRKIFEKYPKIIKIIDRKHNVGMLKNIEECISACSGDFIAFCEADDYWLSNSLLSKKLAIMLKNQNIGMCFNWLLLHIEDTDSFSVHEKQGNLQTGLVSFDQIVDEPLTANFSCCMYRKEALQTLPKSYFSRKSAADWLLNAYVAHEFEIYFLKDLLSVYTIHSKGQWSGLSSEERLSLTNEIKDEFKSIFNKSISKSDRSSQNIDITTYPLGNNILCWLDKPIGSADLNNNKLHFYGWVLVQGYKKAYVIIKTKESVIRLIPQIYRQDVTSKIYSHSVDRETSRCGFEMIIEVSANDEITMEIEFEEKKILWKKISLSQ